jgi:hypothetical protein
VLHPESSEVVEEGFKASSEALVIWIEKLLSREELEDAVRGRARRRSPGRAACSRSSPAG